MSNALSYSFGVTPEHATANTVTVQPPAAYNPGGLLVMCAFGGVPTAGSVHAVTPSGWTPVSALNAPFGVFTKTAAAGETPYTITFSSTCVAIVTVAAYPAATVASSLFATSGNGVFSYTPAAPGGVTASQVVLYFAGGIDYGASGLTSGFHTLKYPAGWTPVIPPIGPSNDSVAGGYQATCIGLSEVTGTPGSTQIQSSENSVFSAGFLVLNIPVPQNTLAVTAAAGGFVPGVAGTSGYTGAPTTGMALTVEALSGTQSAAAIAASGARAASYSLGASAAPGMAITPSGAGSRIQGALMEWQPGVAYTPNTLTTFTQNAYDAVNLAAYGTFHSSAPPAAGAAATFGATGPVNTRVNIALAEILAAPGSTIQSAPRTGGGVLTATALGMAPRDFPAPAVQQTAIFPSMPAPGSLLVASVSVNSNFIQGGVITMALSDSSGLTWFPLSESNTQSGAYAGVWAAYIPAPVASLTAALDITTLEIPTAQAGQAYSVTLAAAGGTGTGYTWVAMSGILPSWAALSSAGVLSGTPTGAASVTNFAAMVTDSGGNTSIQSYVLTVITGPSPGPPGSWTLGFADEFSYAYPSPYGTCANPNIWSDRYQEGDASRVNDNASEYEWHPHGYYGQSVANSVLTLAAVAQNPQSIDPACPNPTRPGGQTGAFTTGTIQGFLGPAFTYGYIEARVQQPAPGNAWCAFWMIPRDNQWPPEIDIAEWQPPGHSGQNQLGYDNTAGTWQSFYTSGDSNTWDVWGCQITPTAVTYYKNGAQVTSHTYDGTAYAWYPIVNVGVDSTSASGYPANYLVDYVRIWVPSGAPAQPAIISISPASGIPSGGSVTVTFGTVAGATSYRVTAAPCDSIADGYAAGVAETNPYFQVSGSSSPLTVTGLPSGVRFNFTVCAINAAGYSVESAVAGPQVINIQMVTAVLPQAQAGVPYSATLAAKAGVTPYTWSVSSGVLPSWASLNTSTGVISGTPSAAGSSSFTVRVTGNTSWSGGTTTANSATVPLTLTVAGAGAGSPVITTASLPGATAGTAYQATLAETGGTAPYRWSISNGALPAWAILNVSTGVISGTPPAGSAIRAGVYRGPCGIYAQNGVITGGAQSGISAYATWLGTSVLYVLDYIVNAPATWAQFTGATLYKAVTGYTTLSTWGALTGGRTMVLGIPACAGRSAGSGGITWAAEASGANDASWTTLGQNLVSWGYGNAVLRIGREFNYGGYNWSPAITGDTPAQYIAGYQHIVTLLRAIPGNNFTFMWNPALSPGTVAGQSGAAAETQNWYPGNAYVDNIGLDVYDWGAYATQAAAPYGNRTLAQQQANFANLLAQQDGITSWNAFALANGKQLAYPEWGLQLWLSGANYAGGGDDAYYISQMQAQVPGTFMEAMWEDLGQGVFDTDTDAARATGMQAPDASRTAYLAEFGGKGGTGSGTAGFTVTITDAAGSTGTQALSITTAATSAGSPVITTASLPGAVIGTPYSAALAATGGTRTGYSWSISNGLLPSWATLNTSTGVISGTPPAGGTITVPAVTTTSLPGGTAGTPYTATLAATEVNETIPPVTGTASFTVQLTDSGFNTATRLLSITTVASGTAGLNFTALPGTLCNASGDAYANVWAATPQVAGSGTISSSGAGSSPYGLAVWVYRGSSGTGAVTSSGSIASSSLTQLLGLTGTNSAVAGGMFDSSAGATAGYGWTPAVTDDREHAQDSSAWSYYVADWGSQGAPVATAFGLTGITSAGPFAQAFTEILGTTTASTSPVARITITPSASGQGTRPGAGNTTTGITITPSMTTPAGAAAGWTTVTWNADDVLKPGTLTGISIGNGAIVAANIAAGAITGDKISANTITAANIAAGTITAAQIAASTITAQQIAAGTIIAANLSANIIAAGIVDGTVIEGATLVAAGTSGQILVYSSNTPASGNLIASVSGAAGSDGLGNSYPAGLNVVEGAITGSNIVLHGASGEILVYQGTPASGNLIHSVSPVPGMDSFGNPYFAGSCAYSTTSPQVVAQLHGGSISVGPIQAIAEETPTWAPGGLSNGQGTLGRAALWSGQTVSNDQQAWIELMSQGAGSGTTSPPGGVYGTININSAAVNIPPTATFSVGNVHLNPPMAIPLGFPLAADPFTGTIFGSGERASYINATISCLNALIQELVNRGLIQ